MTEQGVIAWFARNPVAANLLMGVCIVSGLVSLASVKREVFPAADSYQVVVSVAYPGAAPEEAEEGICERIENELFGLEGVKRILSSATEGQGTVTVEVMREFDPREVLDEVKTRIDAIDNFPQLARQPLVREVVMRRQAVSIAVSGDLDEGTLKRVGEEVRDELANLPEITQVELVSARPYEISIEIPKESLRRHALTLDTVAEAIRRASLDLPGGSIKTEGGEVMLRTIGQRHTGDEFGRIVVITRPDGTRVRVSDLGTVIDGFAESDEMSRFDGERAVLVQVFRVGDQDVMEVVEAARRYAQVKNVQLGDRVHLTLWNDETEILQSRIGLLTSNLLWGLLLVFLVLALFLRLKLAFWVALGIPISFLGCVGLMPTFDISLNMISLFAFLMVLGIVVDDAIVVGESVHTQRKSIKDGTLAAIRGTKIVAIPVTFGVLTTVAAFTPMLDMEDNSRKLWQDIGLIVIGCLLFSLLESKLILPSHLARLDFESKPQASIPRAWAWFRSLFTSGLERFLERVYLPFLGIALRARYVTMTVIFAVAALTFGLFLTGHLKRTFFPAMEGDNVVANLTLPQGTPVETTARLLRSLEQAAREVAFELDHANGIAAGPVRHVLSSIGTQPHLLVRTQNSGQGGGDTNGSHLGEVNLQLRSAEERDISAGEVLRSWKEKVGRLPGVEDLSYTTDLFGSGKDLNVQLTGTDIDALQTAANKVKDYLVRLRAASEISDSFRGGKPELKLSIEPSGQALGLTLQDIATQVRQAFYGEEVQRIQKRGEDAKVMVRFPEDQRHSLATLEDMRIRTPAGDEIPLQTVAKTEAGRGFATISRTDRARTINVTAKVDPAVESADEIMRRMRQEFLPTLVERTEGVDGFSFEGDNRNQAETMESLQRGYMIVMFLIYALLAVPFKSYTQPLLVMTAVPFGFVGAILGHLVLGLEVSIMSMFGLIALTGVVVNDNLVLVDFVNAERRSGTPLQAALEKTCRSRFRPILLTSLTTCASLTPLLLERSVQAMFLIPMATSLAFGVMFATIVSLVLVPCLYAALADVEIAFTRVFGRRRPALDPGARGPDAGRLPRIAPAPES